ncbi:MAG: IS1634 family transposase [Christensenellales bacterium]
MIFAKSFSNCLRGGKNPPRLIAAMKGLLFHRILDPASVLYTRKELSQFAGYKSDYLDLYYEALDAFGACREVMIEHLCRQYEKRTDRKGPVAYYDVTTYAFESVRAGELRLFGFSKEHKNNEVQVVMGLLMDSQGMPISHTLFPGNTMDQSTLEIAVADLKKRYHMEKIVVVADRGLNSKDNLHYLVGEGHDFVMSYSLKKAPRDLQDLVFDEDGWQEQRDGEGKLLARTRRGRSQYIQYDADYSGAVLDEARVAWHSQFDGYSAVITNKPELSTGEVSEIYGGLWKIEESFHITNTNSKHERIVVLGLLPCSFVGCSVSVALLRFPRLLLAASQNPSALWMH